MAGFTVVGEAVQGDFLAAVGSGFGTDLTWEFETAVGTVTVVPDVVRPHLAVVARLPADVPTGPHWLRLRSAGVLTDRIPVDVTARPPSTVRVLYSGEPKPRPYTVVFVGNPAIQSEAGDAFTPDPVLTDRAGYHAVVAYCLRNILTEAEDVLRADGTDGRLRIVSVFDPTLGAEEGNSLAHELAPNLMETRRAGLVSFLARFGEVADMVFVVHGSTTHNRATAWFTTDDNRPDDPTFTYDGQTRRHGRFPRIPGSCTIPTSVNTTGMTALHEFGHAASDFTNGMITDLYHDVTGGVPVNKKVRTQAGGPVPGTFATYDGTVFAADPDRDGIGPYPPTWSSYHPELTDATRPNLMDDYWQSPDTPRNCRLDRLTYAWLRDRLRAKLDR